MSLRIIIGLSRSIIIILANDAWMGYLEMQSCILPAIKHSGKNPPQLLVSRNMTASETWCRSERNTIQVVPGRAGGGSFKRKKNYIAKKEFAHRMCARWPTIAMSKLFVWVWTKLLPLHGCDVMRFGVMCLWFDLLASDVASCEVICGTTLYYKELQRTTPVLLQRTTPVLLCTTKYYSSTTLYYKVLLQYYSVL